MSCRPLQYLLFLLLASVLCGCSTIEVKPTGRVASDQLLNARTIEDAINSMTFGEVLKKKQISLNIATQGIDSEYLKAVVHSWISRNGGVCVVGDEPAEVELNVLVQVAGSDREDSSWSIPIIFPSFQAGLSVTHITFYESITQVARCRLWAYAIDTHRRVIFNQLPIYRTHFLTNSTLFGVSLGRSTDLYELDRIHDFPPLMQ